MIRFTGSPEPLGWSYGFHCLEVELGVAEQCQLNVWAKSLDIRLIEEELAGVLPVAALGSAVGQRQHVGSHVLDRAQDATVLGRERAGQAAFEIDGRPQHGHVDSARPRRSRIRVTVVRPGRLGGGR
jgi:hypothetical protein